MGVLFQTANWSSVLPSIVDSAERDPQYAEVHSQIQRGHAEPLRQLLERGAARGALPSDTDVGTLVAVLLGPLYYRRWFSRESIDERFVDAVVERVFGPS